MMPATRESSAARAAATGGPSNSHRYGEGHEARSHPVVILLNFAQPMSYAKPHQDLWNGFQKTDVMSSKSLLDKMQVKGVRTLAVVNAPKGDVDRFCTPDLIKAADIADVVLVFVENRQQLTDSFVPVIERMRADAILWLAYTKLTSKRAGELNRDVLRRLMPDLGLDTVSQIAIDDDWSALRLKRLVK